MRDLLGRIKLWVLIVVDNFAGLVRLEIPQPQAAGGIEAIKSERMVMKSQIKGLKVASAVFGLVCLAHILRLILGFRIIVGSHYFSRSLSLLAVVVSAFLSIWLWKLAGPGCSDAKATPPSH